MAITSPASEEPCDPTDDEADRELSSRLEDVAHGKHNGAGAQPLVLTARP